MTILRELPDFIPEVKCNSWKLCHMQWVRCDHHSEHRWRDNCYYICPYVTDAECKPIMKKVRRWYEFWKRV